MGEMRKVKSAIVSFVKTKFSSDARGCGKNQLEEENAVISTVRFKSESVEVETGFTEILLCWKFFLPTKFTGEKFQGTKFWELEDRFGNQVYFIAAEAHMWESKRVDVSEDV